MSEISWTFDIRWRAPPMLNCRDWDSAFGIRIVWVFRRYWLEPNLVTSGISLLENPIAASSDPSPVQTLGPRTFG